MTQSQSGQGIPITSATPPTAPPHAPPDDTESIYFDGRPLFGGRPAEVIGLLLLGILFLVSPIILYFTMHHWPAHIVSGVLMIIGVALLIAPAIITKQLRYRISNYRIDFERGLLSKDISTLELWHVEDLSFHQSIVDRLLGIGSIRVLSHDDTMPNLNIRGIPNARTIFEELKQRVIAVKRQSGVLKVDTGT